MMNRRGFLQVLGAAIAAPLVPRPPVPMAWTVDASNVTRVSYIGIDLATRPSRTVVMTLRCAGGPVSADAHEIFDAIRP